MPGNNSESRSSGSRTYKLSTGNLVGFFHDDGLVSLLNLGRKKLLCVFFTKKAFPHMPRGALRISTMDFY
jgi:hypothetical protein